MSSRDELIQTIGALSSLEHRTQSCPIAAYRPHKGQDEFHRARSPIVLCLAGNRFGKTHAQVADTLAAALGYYPWLVPGFELEVGAEGKTQFPDRKKVPVEAWVRRWDGVPLRCPSKQLLLTGLPLKRGVGEILQEKWFELWPPGMEFKHWVVSGTNAWEKIRLPNGSEIGFGSAHQPDLAFEGFATDRIGADEPFTKRLYTAARRGLIDRSGQWKWTMTPLGDASIAWVAADLLDENRRDVAVIEGCSYDNPFQSRAALDNFFNDSAMSEEERQARMHGRISTLGRRIVTTFGSHAVIDPVPLDADMPRVLVVDPHHSKPHVCLWATVLGTGQDVEWVIYREWPTDDFYKMGPSRMSSQEFQGLIKTLEGDEDVQWRFCDPQFGPQKAKVLGTQHASFVDQMARYKMVFSCDVDNDVDRGIDKLRDVFRPSTVTGRPRMRIFSSCRNAIRSARLWSYEGLTEEGKLKVSEVYKDFCDAMRYMAMAPYVQLVDGYSYWEPEDD
jgi:hypothetical protein